MTEYRVDIDAVPWGSPLPGVRFKAYIRDGKRLRLVEYAREFVEPDWCTAGHTGYVLEGEFVIDFDGLSVQFGAGDGIMIPEGEDHKHRARMLSDLVRVVLVEDV